MGVANDDATVRRHVIDYLQPITHATALGSTAPHRIVHRNGPHKGGIHEDAPTIGLNMRSGALRVTAYVLFAQWQSARACGERVLFRLLFCA